MIELGGLVGRVGVSYIGEKTLSLFQSKEEKEEGLLENWIKNAQRIAETLGRMRGGAMKIGQMLSLHDGFLPKEVTQILAVLQKDAPQISVDQIKKQIKNEVADPYIFKSIEPTAYAAASIGQVHRAVLTDGRSVVVKVQYPGIEEVIYADMKNLRGLLGSLISMISKADMTPVWAEMEDRLYEELDYEMEAKNIEKMGAFSHEMPGILTPKVVPEASGKRVLTMELLEGIPPSEAMSDKYGQELKNKWGAALFEWIVASLFQRRFLHADPNLANFAFRETGEIIVYDYGCMKDISEVIAAGYAGLVRAGLEGEGGLEKIPEILKNMGIHRVNGEMIPVDLARPYFNLLREPVRRSPSYEFGADNIIYEKLMELGRTYWYEALDIQFPKDIVFIDRTFAGHFGNLNRLRACANWREIIEKYVAPPDV